MIRHVPEKPSLGPDADGPALSSEASRDFPGWEGGGHQPSGVLRGEEDGEHQPSGVLKGSLEAGEEQEASECAMLYGESD